MSQLNWGELVSQAADSGTGTYEPLPDGEYELKVIEASSVLTQTGKPMFKVTTEVQTGAFAKRRVWDNLVVSKDSDKALGIFFGKMAALGLPKEYFLNSPTNEQIASALIGRAFRGQLGRREYAGKISNEIKRYAPLTAPTGGVPAGVPAQAAAPAPAPAPAPAAAPAPAVAPQAFAPAPTAEATPPAPPF